MMKDGWIGVDLDGTLAYYDHWRGIDHIGSPIPLMLDRVKFWINFQKFTVKIVTARVSGPDGADALPYIQNWCKEHIGHVLEVTCCKDFAMKELWDDRAIQVQTNTGKKIV